MVEFILWSSIAGGRSIRIFELLRRALASSCRPSQRNGFLCRIVFKGAGSQSQGGMAGGTQRAHTIPCHFEESSDIDMAPFSQHVVARMLDTGFFSAHLQRLRSEYRRRRDVMLETL